MNYSSNGRYSPAEHEVEQFEDDPLEYIRRDMSLGSEGSETRRHAAQELIRALMSIGLEAEITKLIEHYISLGLQVLSQNFCSSGFHPSFLELYTKSKRELAVKGYGNLPPDSDRRTSLDKSSEQYRAVTMTKLKAISSMV